MMWRATWLLCLVGAATPLWAESPRMLAQQAEHLYEQGEYAEAAKVFAEAEDAARDTQLDPSIAAYNRARALAETGEHDAAAEAYADALHTTDLKLQQKAYHNRGNALVRRGEAYHQEQNFDESLSALRESLTMFEKAITLDPADTDPKINHELATRLLEQVQQEQQEQQEQGDQEQEQPQDEQEEQESDEESDENQEQESQDESEDSEQEQSEQEQNEQDSEQDQENEDEERESSQSQAEPRPSEEMTPEEAEMLLDAIREEEQAERARVRFEYGTPREVEKDW